MEPIFIRKARLSDMDSLLQFEQGVITAERPFDETLKTEPIRYYDLQQLLTAQHIRLLVAQCGAQIIGSGYARIETAKPYLKHSRYAYLGFMYVLPAYRGKGVNKMIIDELKQWAAAQGITELRLEVYHDNEPAIKAYEKAGFSRHMIEMRMGLDVE
ncbi:MAG TPA: GNAT family N-acetyltransferase [Mucilaginibacter sp.]|nr:GNAT family N-acetyltransferase [Mucilaginibacter sp.]